MYLILYLPNIFTLFNIVTLDMFLTNNFRPYIIIEHLFSQDALILNMENAENKENNTTYHVNFEYTNHFLGLIV